MSPLRKMMSEQWNVLSRNLLPLPDLKAMSPLALLLRRGGDVVGEEKARKSRIQPMASIKGGNKSKKLVNKKSFLASVNRRRNKLLKGIEKDFYSETSRAPKDSRRLTIKKLLKSEVVKLDVVKIKLIATAFKEAGYKSGSSYLAEAKLMHVEEGGDWTPQLDRVFKMSKRALDRGKGPRKKAPEVPVQVRREALIRKKKLSTKVLFPKELFQFGIAWMLREVEIRFFEVRDLVVDWQKKRITLCWRTSKCDQSGEEVRRTLQCLCAGDMCAWECPFFSTIDLLDKVKKAKRPHSKLALNGDGSPLWKLGVRSSRWKPQGIQLVDQVPYTTSGRVGTSPRLATWGGGSRPWSWSTPRRLWNWHRLTKHQPLRAGPQDPATWKWQTLSPRTSRWWRSKWRVSRRIWKQWRWTSRRRWRSWKRNVEPEGGVCPLWCRASQGRLCTSMLRS